MLLGGVLLGALAALGSAASAQRLPSLRPPAFATWAAGAVLAGLLLAAWAPGYLARHARAGLPDAELAAWFAADPASKETSRSPWPRPPTAR